jgi:outer membrane cobalamin receptor
MVMFVSLLLPVLGFAEVVFAQQAEDTGPEDFFEMSLEELAEIPIDVASKKESTAREAPGVVTVITRDQIQKSGARDLIDILRLVPGFDVGYDISGAFGVAIRGIWANEGKVLVLMDGVPLNDEMYGTFQYGHHIPVDIIERIEIMRGPGSVMYGESAELGVISIKTMALQKEDDIFVSTRYSRMESTFGRKTVTGFYGTKKDDFSLSIAGHYAHGNFSDRDAANYDLGGDSYDMGENNNSLIRSPFFNLSAQWGNLSTRMIFDRYRVNSPWPAWGTTYRMRFYSDIYQVQYKWPIADNLSVTSKFLYKRQKPWNWLWTGWDNNKITSDKYTTDTFLSWDLAGGHNIIAGMAYDEIKGKDENGNGVLAWASGKNNVDYDSLAFYSEGFFKTPFGNLTAGARYIDHSETGWNLVPRFALTNVFGDYYVKLLYSKAYRSPSIMNFAYNQAIKSEETTIYELEVGAQLSDSLSVSANAFDVEVQDPIIYSYRGSSNYTNFKRTGSRGIELAANYKKDIYDVGLTYSWYEASDNKVDEYAIPNENDLLLGFPAHKVSLYASVNPAEDLFITPTVTYYSPRHAVNSASAPYTYEKHGSAILTNISLLKRNAFNTKGLDLGFSIYNIFNEDYSFIEPYHGGCGPMPGPPRSFIFTLSYHF